MESARWVVSTVLSGARQQAVFGLFPHPAWLAARE
jgi:hypothetical protein